MQTQAERNFDAEFKAYKTLFWLNGFKGKEKVKFWIRSYGKEVLKEVDKEVNSDWIKAQLKRQSPPEQHELDYMAKI